MATDREMLQKLYKIARNQQKIINKLAQQVNAPTQVWDATIAQRFLPAGYVVTDASTIPSEKTVTATIQVPEGSTSQDPEWAKFKQDAVQYLSSMGYSFAGGQPIRSF